MIAEIFAALRNTTSRNEKLEILQKHADNDQLKSLFILAESPHIRFNVGATRLLATGIVKGDAIKGELWVDCPSPAYNSPSPMEAAIYALYVLAEQKDFHLRGESYYLPTIARLPKEEQGVVLSLLLKDARANVGASIINTVWPNAIPELPYMRCSLPTEVDLSTWDWEQGVFSQLKADGMYAESNELGLVSRQSHAFPMELFEPEFVEELGRLFNQVGEPVTGELTLYRNGELLPRKEGNGLLTKLLKHNQKLPEDVFVMYSVWDFRPTTEENQTLPYEERLDKLVSAVSSLPLQHIKVISTFVVYHKKGADAHLREVWKEGLEGTVLKRKDMLWEDTTSKGQVKNKLFVQIDMRCTGVYNGKAGKKNAYALGGILLESECGKVRCKCGSGFTQDQRVYYSKFPEEIVGKIVQVSTTELSRNKKDDTLSLSLPIFEEVRHDKSTADDLARIEHSLNSVRFSS